MLEEKPQVGSKIRCITSEIHYITFNKIYTVIPDYDDLGDEYFWYLDDDGDLMYSYLGDDYFEKVEYV